jgi:[acyl-carrier-protein] S-malonyltransferase
MSLGLLFPGQGTQHPHMLGWLEQAAADSPALKALQTHLGGDWRQKMNAPGWAYRNEVAQVLLTGVSLAAWAALEPHLPAPRAVVGYSVGELAAISVAGALDAPTAVQLALRRAGFMDACVAHGSTGLLALQGLGTAQTQALCAQFGIHLSIRLSPSASIVGGANDGLALADEAARQLGATTQRLSVPLASHTPLLAKATGHLATALAELPMVRPRATVICNLHGHAEHTPQGLRHALAQQVAHTVQWERCMVSLREAGVSCVLEVGPGNTLARLWQSAHPDIPARSIDDFQQPQGVVDWVRRHCPR